MNLAKIIKYVQMWFISTYYGYLKAARWNVSVRVVKNYGVEQTVHIWVQSPWPAQKNTLIHSVMEHEATQNILEDYGLVKGGKYVKDLDAASRERIQVFGLSNQRGPVAYQSFFITDTYEPGFIMPGTEIDPPKAKPVDNPKK
jgi:hypothetical protein